MADVIVFMVNVREGMTAADRDVAAMLQKSGKPVLLAANKVDNPGEPPMEMYEFYNLGIGDPWPVSSIHGLGIGDLLDEIVKFFPEACRAGGGFGNYSCGDCGKTQCG